MLKKQVTYTDFDNNKRTDTLFFHLTRADMMEMIDLQPRLEAWQENVSGEERALTTAEVKELLDLIKLIIEKSYGQRDGDKFRKSASIFQDFRDSAAYDEFLFSLFDNEGKNAVEFLTAIVPQGLTPPTETVELDHTETEVPAWIREDRDPTNAEMAKMTQAQLTEAFRRKLERESSDKSA